MHAGPTDNQSKRVSSMLCTNKAAQDTQPCMETTYSASRPPNSNLDPRVVDDRARSPDSVLIHMLKSVKTSLANFSWERSARAGY